MIALSLALAFAGFAGLSLALERHHEQVFGHRRIPADRHRMLRIMGWGLMAVSPAPCIAQAGWADGSLLWCGLLTAAVLPLALLLAYAPRRVAAAAVSALPAGAIAALLAS